MNQTVVATRENHLPGSLGIFYRGKSPRVISSSSQGVSLFASGIDSWIKFCEKSKRAPNWDDSLLFVLNLAERYKGFESDLSLKYDFEAPYQLAIAPIEGRVGFRTSNNGVEKMLRPGIGKLMNKLGYISMSLNYGCNVDLFKQLLPPDYLAV